MRCPLCDSDAAGASWLGATDYAGQSFAFVQCRRCSSLFCDPMPSQDVLMRMYGPEYEALHSGQMHEDPRDQHFLKHWLTNDKAGTFVDFGCGRGDLLKVARDLGWRAVGFELSPQVAQAAAQQTGLEVVSEVAALPAGVADVVYLGDVIEHLTNLNAQFAQILSLLRPGGLLLAQGPLEANRSLFTWGLKIARQLRPKRIEMAPYHVILATARGQDALFARFGLAALEFTVTEVSWPAPTQLELSDLRKPRSVGLFALRRLSRVVSRAVPGRWGNRYTFAGVFPG